MFLWVPMLAEAAESKKEQKVYAEKNDSLLLKKLLKTRIIMKDGSIKKNCKVTEIKEYWIVYEKEGSLHDVMIEKIERIEFNNGTQAVFFDEKNKPEIETWKTY